MKESSFLNPLSWPVATWKRFFAISAAWNLVGGLPSFLLPGLNLDLFYGASAESALTLFLNRGFWFFVLVFGVGYAIVARNPRRNAAVIGMGLAGKTGVAAGWIWLWLQDAATELALLAAMGDAAFAVFFLLFLASGRKA